MGERRLSHSLFVIRRPSSVVRQSVSAAVAQAFRPASCIDHRPSSIAHRSLIQFSVVDSPRIEQLKRRVSADPASLAFAALAEEYRKEGRYPEAIETCRVGLQRHPAYLSARVTLGRALIGVGDYEAARLELEAVLRVAPENLAAIRAMADIYSRLQEIEDIAPDVLESAAAATPATPEDHPIPEPTPTVAAAPRLAPIQLASIDPEPHRNTGAITRLERFLDAITAARAEESPENPPTPRGAR